MTSRFFATGDTTSESDSELSTPEVEVVTKVKPTRPAAVDSSSDDDDERRESKSKKDKVFDAIEATAMSIRVALRRKNWQTVGTQYAALQKLFQAPTTVTVLKTAGIPKTYLRCVVELDSFTADAYGDKDYRDALPAADSKALANTRNAVAKLIKALAKKVEDYNKSPLPNDDEALAAIISSKDKRAAAAAAASAPVAAAKPAAVKKPAVTSSMFYAPGDSDEEDEDEDEDEDEEVAPVKKAAPTRASNSYVFGDSDEEESEEEEEEEEEESEEESSDDDDGDEVDLKLLNSGKITRAFWVRKERKVVAPVENRRDRRAQQTQERQRRAAETGDAEDDSHVYSASSAAAAAAMQSMGLAANDEVTPAMLNKRLREVVAMRGKLNTNNPQTILELRALEPKAHDAATALRIQSLIPLLMFDHLSQRGTVMSVRAWTEAMKCVYRILATLKAHPELRLAEEDSMEGFGGDVPEEDQEMDEYVDSGDEDAAWAQRRQRAREEAARRRARVEEELKKEQSAETAGITFVEGNLWAFVFKISNEFYRGLQMTEHTSPEYVHRLSEQPALVGLLGAVRDYYRSINKPRLEAQVAHLWIEYEYYYYRPQLDVLSPAIAETEAAKAPSATLVDDLAVILYRSDDLRARVRALLFQTYFWLLHNRYDEARERLLSAHVQDVVNDMDLSTRSLYNRVMAQLGLAAFRRGHYRAAVVALLDLQMAHRVKDKLKELLGQGVAIREAKEEELVEARRRMLPYHMHLSLTDLIDAVSMISAMLVEVPLVAEGGWQQQRVVSRPFRREYQKFVQSLSQNATGDSTRDVIMSAAKSLFEGDWRNCLELLFGLRLWSFVHEADSVRETLKHTVKVEALRAFLLTYGPAYTSLALADLVAKFELPEKEVVRVASKLIHTDALPAAWSPAPGEEGERVLIVAAPAQSRTQRLATQFVGKVQQFAERVDKLADVRSGNYGKSHNRRETHA